MLAKSVHFSCWITPVNRFRRIAAAVSTIAAVVALALAPPTAAASPLAGVLDQLDLGSSDPGSGNPIGLSSAHGKFLLQVSSAPPGVASIQWNSSPPTLCGQVPSGSYLENSQFAEFDLQLLPEVGCPQALTRVDVQVDRLGSAAFAVKMEVASGRTELRCLPQQPKLGCETTPEGILLYEIT
jgi:hypothetical protein